MRINHRYLREGEHELLCEPYLLSLGKRLHRNGIGERDLTTQYLNMR